MTRLGEFVSITLTSFVHERNGEENMRAWESGLLSSRVARKAVDLAWCVINTVHEPNFYLTDEHALTMTPAGASAFLNRADSCAGRSTHACLRRKPHLCSGQHSSVGVAAA